MNSFIGIDPGSSSGGMAIVGASLEAHGLPETERDIYDMLMSFKARGVAYALIEDVHSMPEQGVSSSFKFGRSYGFLRGILTASGIPFGQIAPQTWQKIQSCRTHGDKNVSKARAQQLFPGLKITHKTADALLIADTARILYLNSHPDEWKEHEEERSAEGVPAQAALPMEEVHA
jgi:crossover junction endodeoxyribonuclease RuvC